MITKEIVDKYPSGRAITAKRLARDEWIWFVGPGWYGCRQTKDSLSQYTAWYFVGGDRNNPPSTYSKGLSKPEWFE